MTPTLSIAISIFAILWIIDAFQTVTYRKKLNNIMELNPVSRFFLKRKLRKFIAFKVLDVAVLCVVWLLLYSTHQTLALSLVFLFDAVYLFVVMHNWYIYRKIRMVKE